MFSTDTSTRVWPSLNTRRSKLTRRKGCAVPSVDLGAITWRSSRTSGPESHTLADQVAGSTAMYAVEPIVRPTEASPVSGRKVPLEAAAAAIG